MEEIIINLLKKATNLTEEEISNLIEIPPNPELGDYAFPCFILSSKLKKNPQEIAKSLADKIKISKEIDKIQSQGPYINFFLNSQELAEATIKKIQKEKEKYGSAKMKEKVLIESPGPNTNKPLHIGHARNIILAQSIKKLLEFLGKDVKIVDIINDRGVHICKSMIAYEKFGKGNTPEKAEKKSDHFVGDYYVKFFEEAKKNPKLDEEVHECLRKWESGDKDTLALWKKMNNWALQGFKETYDKFNLKTDKTYYESEIYQSGKEIILEQFKKGTIDKKKDGAYFADLTREGLGEKILLRGDGTSIYITQDLYLAILRKKEYNFDKLIYVVANEQNHHFKTLFTLLKLFGYKWADKLYHLNYGLVHLESGRLKSREGNIVDADDTIEITKNLALEEINKRYKDLSQKEKESRAMQIAMSAIRYFFLKIDRLKDLTFIPQESLSFEGNTGPYLLYTYARARSILKKAKYTNKKAYKIKEMPDMEKQLIFHIARFPQIVLHSYRNLSPNIIANYAYQIAKIFNELYHSDRILGSENEQFKLVLLDSFSQVLKNALSLLEIDTIDKM